MALTYVMSSPLNTNSPRKHTEKHGIFINHIDVFREIRCDSVAIDQDQGLSQCHWDQAKGRNRHEAVAKSYNAHHRIGVSRNVDGLANTLDGE